MTPSTPTATATDPMRRKPSTVLGMDAKAWQGLPEPWFRPEPGQAAGLERDVAVPISEISRWLGQKSIITTVDLYGHLRPRGHPPRP